MSSSLQRRPAARLALAVALALAACGSEAPVLPAPSVTAVEPACGDAAVKTTVSIQGAMPASPELSFSDPGSSRLVTAYRAWIALPGGAEVELTEVTWKSATELSAVVPLGLPAGSYGVTVEGPTGARGTTAGAFRVQQGSCPVATAALVVSAKAEPATVTVGQDVTVTATVQNVGQAGALAVSTSITPPATGLTLGTGPAGPQDVPAGQARTFQWTYRATAPGGGVFLVAASGTAADTGHPVAAQPVNTNAVLVSVGTFLTANTVASSATVTVGQLLSVVLTVTNHTTAAVLATPAMVATGPVAPGNAPAPASVPAGSTLAFQWTYTATAAGAAAFTASVSGTNPASGDLVTVPTAKVDVLVQAAPGLNATLSIPATLELGDFTVTMVVSNAGGPGAADVAQMTPDLPAARAGSTAAVSLKSGPVGAPATVASGQPAVSVTWVFTATRAGTLSLASTARGRDANTGAQVASAEAVSNVAQVAQHTLGGTVSGLAGTGLVLHNGTESLPIAPGTTPGSPVPFTFVGPLPTGATYVVTVTGQPAGPTQACTVASGSGTVGAANVTNVAVTCVTSSFTVGGTIAGLLGTGLVLQNGAERLTIQPGATSFTFATPVASGVGYAVTVATEPNGPTQTCTIARGSGTMAGANVTDVAVTCARRSYTISGTITGLTGAGLVLNDGSESLPVAAGAATFAFPTAVASGSTYAVTVTTRPTGPSQTCLVTNGTGTVTSANVTNVAVACSVDAFTVGGTVSGLATGNSVTLRNGTESRVISANGAYAFPTPVPSGSSYAVTVTVQPTAPTQVCTVANGTGTVGAANVTNVNVSCATSSFTVGGTVSGLAAGASMTLHNGAESRVISANGAYTLATPVPSGSSYAVTVTVQPTAPTQVCTVANGTGTVGAANVTNVNVSCVTSSFAVGGAVSGLAAGNTVTLRNGTESLVVSANGSYAFSTLVTSGAGYAVAVTVQPTTPTQACAVVNGTGTMGGAAVTNVDVTCTTSSFTVGGTVSGLAAGNSVTLHNGADSPVVSANGGFTFATPVASGATYAVTVTAQPTTPTQVCTVANGSGTMGGGAVTNVAVTCATSSFTVGGTVSGLAAGNSVTLHNGADSPVVSANGGFTFATPVASGATYAVTVTAQPTTPTQVCTVANGSGTVGAANVTNVAVTCATSSFTVGGTVSGLAAGASVTLHNGSDSRVVSANGGFTFATPVASGATYAVTVTAQPTTPTQVCTVANGSGTVGAANVTNVAVTCATSSFTVGGTLTGLAAAGSIVLQDNGADDLTLTADGPFTFPTPVPSGATYAVTVATPPTGQLCLVTGGGNLLGGGTVGAAAVTSVQVTCL